MTALEALRQAWKQGFSASLQRVVIDSQDAELAYRYTHDLRDADLDILEPAILASDDPHRAYDYAVVKGERGGDVSQLQARMMRWGVGGLLVLFAIDVAGADVDLAEEALKKHPIPKFLQLFEAEMRQRGA